MQYKVVFTSLYVFLNGLWDTLEYDKSSFFFFNDTATTEIYTLSLHDALPICPAPARLARLRGRKRCLAAARHPSHVGATRQDPRLDPYRRVLATALRRRGPVILIWDGLGAHTSRAMRAYLARQRRWLHVERLPGYAPELNPIEQVWGNVKARELANVCAEKLTALRRPLHTGFARVRRQSELAFAFLRHTGLQL